LKYFSSGITLGEACGYAAVISVTSLVVGLLPHHYYILVYSCAMRMRLACSGLIYRKVCIT
jgi:hypothetical protein